MNAKARQKEIDEATPCVSGCQRTGNSRLSWCLACRSRRNLQSKKTYHERVARGQCPYCTDAASIGIFCQTHWFKNVGVSHGLGSKRGVELLKNLWEEQHGRCAVTGVKLTPGFNASIDHITPKSRGGSSDKSNLRWVLLRINQCKWDMTHEEFVEVCRLVVRTQEQRVGQAIATDLSTRSN